MFQIDTLGLIKELKSCKTVKEAYIRSLDIGDGYTLIPFCKALVNDDNLINLLCKWRNEFVHVYPTQFKATFDSTLSWAKNVLLNDDSKILFIICSPSGSYCGHVGLANLNNKEGFFEIDNLIKGDKYIPPNLIIDSCKELIKWAYNVLLCSNLFLKVFEDNREAVFFWRRNDFVIDKKIPLKKIKSEDKVSYITAKNDGEAEKNFLVLKHKRSFYRENNDLILTAGPSISFLESSYAYDAALNGWNSNWSKYLDEFETFFASYIGSKYAIATSSCTGALHIALEALEIGPNDEVIVPDQTWVATANAVRYVGATPVFADIDLDTWTIDPDSIRKYITSKTKAIIPVHMYGNPAKMDEIIEIANEYDIRIIEDAAPSIGATFKGAKTGSFGDFGAFSFQGAKLMVTGEGGMLVTNDKNLYEKAKKVWDQGRNAKHAKAFWIDEKGLKYKMSNVQAAIGVGQLRRIDDLISKKRKINKWYRNKLGEIKSITFQNEYQNSESICWMTSFRVLENSNITRDELMRLLKENGIDSRPVFPAISSYPIWDKKMDESPKVNSEIVGSNSINLPSGVCLSEEKVNYICDTIKKLI